MKKESSYRYILAATACLLAAAAVSRFSPRFDLTAARANTVTPHSRSVLAGLDAEVRVTWVRSPKLASFFPQTRAVGDALEAYAHSSRGRVRLVIADPESISAQVRSSLGLVPRQVPVPTPEGERLVELYSGVVVEYRGKSLSVPFADEPSLVEYDLTRIVGTLVAGPRRLTLVWGVPDPDRTHPYVIPWLEYAGFAPIAYAAGEPIDPASVLLVIGSQAVSGSTANEIDAFLARGGNAVFLVSANEVRTDGDWTARAKGDDPVAAILASLGIRLSGDLVLDPSCYRITMPALDSSKYELVNYPFWVTVLASNASPGPLASGFTGLQLFWPSELILATEPDRRLTPALFSTDDAVRMGQPFDTNPFGSQASLFARGEGKRAILAATSEARGRVFAIGDEFFVGTSIEFTGSDYNLDYLVSAVEWASGKDGLLQTKRSTPDAAASSSSDPTVTASDRARGAQRGALISLVILPATLILAWAALALARRRRP